MLENQDAKIQELLDVVEKKKSELVVIDKLNFKTNCKFSYNKDGSSSINLNIINDEEELLHIYSFLELRAKYYKSACISFDIKDKPFKWCGFLLEEWLDDLALKISKIKYLKKKSELESLQKRLDALVSKEMKDMLELEAIMKILTSHE